MKKYVFWKGSILECVDDEKVKELEDNKLQLGRCIRNKNEVLIIDDDTLDAYNCCLSWYAMGFKGSMRELAMLLSKLIKEYKGINVEVKDEYDRYRLIKSVYQTEATSFLYNTKSDLPKFTAQCIGKIYGNNIYRIAGSLLSSGNTINKGEVLRDTTLKAGTTFKFKKNAFIQIEEDCIVFLDERHSGNVYKANIESITNGIFKNVDSDTRYLLMKDIEIRDYKVYLMRYAINSDMIDVNSIEEPIIPATVMDAMYLNDSSLDLLPLKESYSDIYKAELVKKDNITQIVYIDKERAGRIMEGKDWQILGNHTKASKFIFKLIDVEEKKLYKYTMGLNCILEGEDIIQVIEGNDIKFAYMNNVDDGTIGRSCMRYDECQPYLDIYRDNAKMIVIKDQNDKIMLRALLWEITHYETGNKITFIDRIYCSNDNLIHIVKRYATKNGYYMLRNQTYDENTAVLYDENGIKETLNLKKYYIQLKQSCYKYYPFLDTFYYLIGDKLYNSLKHIKKLRSTQGGFNEAIF